jgi:hypothetical protein
MDYPTRLFLWSLLAAAFFGLLGALFGGFTSLVNHFDGRAAGSFVGHLVARAFEPLPASRRAALVGSVDGLAFGALLGTALVFALLPRHDAAWPRLRPVFATGLVLVAVALVLGLVATRLARSQRPAVVGLSLGGFLGMSVGYFVGQADGLLLGAWSGLLGGALLGLWLAARS